MHYQAEFLWASDAKCRGRKPEPFYPNSNHFERGIAICKGCPVKDECLQYALDHHELFGVWGGTTPQERARMIYGLRS